MVAITPTFNARYYLGIISCNKTPELSEVSKGIVDRNYKNLALKVLEDQRKDHSVNWINTLGVVSTESHANKIAKYLERKFGENYQVKRQKQPEVSDGFIYIKYYVDVKGITKDQYKSTRRELSQILGQDYTEEEIESLTFLTPRENPPDLSKPNLFPRR
jgi:hypothetical protein